MTKGLSRLNALSRGTLLVASPEVDTPLFARSVVLICEHSLKGTFGLIINKPMDPKILKQLFPSSIHTSPSIKLSSGGPVEPHQLMILHNHPKLTSEALEVSPGLYLGADLASIQELSLQQDEDYYVCFCLGYSGWDQGQLEQEVMDNQWFLAPCLPDLILAPAMSDIWSETLKRMGSKYAPLSFMPTDLSLN